MDLGKITAESLRSMRTLTPSGASFAKAAAQAVVGETPAEVCGATAAAAKATPVVAKAEAKH